MSELLVSSPEDLGQAILVEHRGEQRPSVAPDALVRLVTEGSRSRDDGNRAVYLFESNR